MIKNLILQLADAKTFEEILSYKPQILELYDKVFQKTNEESCFIGNYDDIKCLHFLESPMLAFYGNTFYKDSGLPFIKEHRPETIYVLELIVLFYTIQIIELLENGFWNEVSLCVYENPQMPDMIDHFEKVNYSKMERTNSLFLSLWDYFAALITIKDNECEIIVPYVDKEGNLFTNNFYIDSKSYEKVLDMIYRNFTDSKYSVLISRILGKYRRRFTKMKYILKYQPMFVEVGYNYIFAIIW